MATVFENDDETVKINDSLSNACKNLRVLTFFKIWKIRIVHFVL